jgi:hypothetical protein
MEGVTWVERFKWANVKYTNGLDTLRNSLNINLNINNEKQNCKICIMSGARVIVQMGW